MHNVGAYISRVGVSGASYSNYSQYNGPQDPILVIQAPRLCNTHTHTHKGKDMISTYKLGFHLNPSNKLNY